MKLAPRCYECLHRLAQQAVELATDDTALRQKAITEALNILNNDFSPSKLSIEIATKIHQIVREITGNPDHYRAIKEKEMLLARELYIELSLRAEVASGKACRSEFRHYLKLAAAANAIDFFREFGAIKEDIRKPVTFVLDDSERLQAKLKTARKILYLADNAGEVYFDLPLVKWMRQFAHVIYVVKPAPVQNDLTLDDFKRAGLESELGDVITTGVASPGIVFSLASAEFKREFESADLIFAKGMGHYEALSELPQKGAFFYCLKAKCHPVADSLGVPVNSYVALLQ